MLAAAVVVFFVRRASMYPYKAIPHLLSPAECLLLRALQAAFADRYLVFAKVRIADLIAVKGSTRNKAGVVALNRIAAKHVDFVLVAADAATVICAIELDDASHQRRDRRDRDRFVNEVFRVARVPLARVKCSNQYHGVELRALVDDAVSALELKSARQQGRDVARRLTGT